MYDKIVDNTFISNGIVIAGGHRDFWNTHTIEYNTANNKPIRYYKDINNILVPTETSQVIMANCNNFTIQNLNINNVDAGIQLGFSSETNISNNTVTDNKICGIKLESSSYNNITYGNNITNNGCGILLTVQSNNNDIHKNNIINNNLCGILLSGSSSSNSIYHNNFFNNMQHALTSDNSPNFWDNDYPCGGNYWESYAGVDNNEDGIGEVTYIINGSWNNQDYYPLIHPYGSIKNLNSGKVFLTIQKAIDDPETSGTHTIFVKSDIYNEHVNLNKSINLSGENKETTIIDGNGTGNVVFISVDQVNITGFTIQNSGSNYDAGIYISSYYNLIARNNIINNTNGIYLEDSCNNSISENTITDNQLNSISLVYSNNNTISENTISNNTGNGIFLSPLSNHNILVENTLNNNIFGIHTFQSSHNIIVNNKIIKNNWAGIRLDESFKNIIHNNNITENGYYGLNQYTSGINLYHSNNNNITDNFVKNNNMHGIQLYGSYNEVINNIITNNNESGINFLYESNSNTISSNYITKNGEHGIDLNHSNSNSFIKNNIKNNSFGICIHHQSSINNFTANNISSNEEYGIYICSGTENFFWNNTFIENIVKNAYEESSVIGNFWNNNTVGNLWGDLRSNPGCQGSIWRYLIPGDGDGVDLKPIGALNSGIVTFISRGYEQVNI
jgi:parallel beta-helix repeat protein